MEIRIVQLGSEPAVVKAEKELADYLPKIGKIKKYLKGVENGSGSIIFF